MGKLGTYAYVSVEAMEKTVSKLVGDYADSVFRATEDGLDAAEAVLIRSLESASPRRRGKFAKGWKSTGKKYKHTRFVHNTTMVKGREGDIPLSNILEYSTVRGNPFIMATFEAATEPMAQAVVNAVKGAG